MRRPREETEMLLAEEEQVWSKELAAQEAALPDLAAVLMVRVAPLGSSE
jgi:hypothetical protein